MSLDSKFRLLDNSNEDDTPLDRRSSDVSNDDCSLDLASLVVSLDWAMEISNDDDSLDVKSLDTLIEGDVSSVDSVSLDRSAVACSPVDR